MQALREFRLLQRLLAQLHLRPGAPLQAPQQPSGAVSFQYGIEIAPSDGAAMIASESSKVERH